MDKLTPKQKVFVDEYLIDLNATRAYKSAYKSCKKDETARTNSSRMLTNANIKVYIEERMKEREKRTEITQDKVLKELAKIAFANGSDFAKVVDKTIFEPVYDGDGNIIDKNEEIVQAVKVINTDDIEENKLAAISEIKETKYGIQVSTYDKVRALELIGKHLGMFKDKVELSGGINVDNPFEGLTTEQLIKLASEDDG